MLALLQDPENDLKLGESVIMLYCAVLRYILCYVILYSRFDDFAAYFSGSL